MRPRHPLWTLPTGLLLCGAMLLVLSLLVACGMTVPPTTLPVATVVLTTTVDPNNKYAGDQQLYVDLTEIALTPRPLHLTPPATLASVRWWPPDVPYTAAGAGYILTGVNPPARASDFKMGNEWVELRADHRLDIYAGGQGSDEDPRQGELIIYVRTLDGYITSGGGSYLTPTKAGPVTITDAVGERLTLQAADGTRFTFDLPTRQWVNP